LNNFNFQGYNVGNATPGYVEFPNGLIFQWGLVTPSNTAYIPVGGTFYTNVTFPFPFPTNLFNIQFAGQRDDVVVLKQMVIKETANGGAVAPSVTGFALYYNSNQFGPVYWQAIGN
jgi:hypothetical protein